jgi:RimJ/RimL family protein N-acetyltransferase
MEVVRPSDASAFLDLAGPLLERDEARNDLILGIAGTLVRRPDAYPRVLLWVVVGDARPVAAALQTEPYPLVIAVPEGERALDALLRTIHEDGAPIPGVTATLPHAEEAARRWASLTGSSWERTLSQGVYALTEVLDVAEPAGEARVATPRDRPLLLEWLSAFAVEALPHPEDEIRHLERSVDGRFAGAESAMWIWETGAGPVALAGYGGPTSTGIRVGPVYTPPEHRRRGYATALVAALSRSLLDEGYRVCFLHTDLANPTSNAIYERIGYERVAEAAEIRFRDP